MRRVSSIERSCLECGAAFQVKRSEVSRGHGLYCSRSCARSGTQRTGRTFHRASCQQCHRDFIYPKGGARAAKFCSNKCTGDFYASRYSADYKGIDTVAAAGRIRPKRPVAPKWRKWKVEMTPVRVLIRELVQEVGKCQECGSTNNLHGHHIKSRSAHPELMTDRANIQILCVDCHAGKHPSVANLIRASMNTRKTVKKKICIECGEPYKPDTRHYETALWCSRECRRGRRRSNMATTHEVMVTV